VLEIGPPKPQAGLSSIIIDIQIIINPREVRVQTDREKGVSLSVRRSSN
jgi:hypothetical protein